MTLPDFTNGDSIPAGAKHDWNLGATGARGWMYCETMVTTDARQIAKLPENAPVVRYVAPFHWSRLFRFLGQQSDSQTKVQVSLFPESFRLQAGKLYYLSTHLFSRR